MLWIHSLQSQKTNSKPNKPTGLSVKAEESALVLNWEEAKNATTYSVYYRKKGEGAFKKAEENIENTNYKLTGLSNDVAYEAYVTGLNDIGERIINSKRFKR